jgi:hypothetical protein
MSTPVSAKKQIKGFKNLRVAELEDKKISEVWCLNNTKPRGEIALTVKSPSDGSRTLVTIPATWVPVCLTEQVPKNMLLNSPEFRRLVASGGILLVLAADVDSILGDADVSREMRNLSSKSHNADESAMVPTTYKENINILVLDLISREKNNEIQENEAYDILLKQEDSLQREDFEYLIKNSTFAKIKKWAATTLTELDEEE